MKSSRFLEKSLFNEILISLFKKAFSFILLAIFFLILNFVGLTNYLIKWFDVLTNPVFVSFSRISKKWELAYENFVRYDYLLEENLELKVELAKSQNLNKKYSEIQTIIQKVGIEKIEKFYDSMARVAGTQNLYSVNASLRAYMLGNFKRVNVGDVAVVMDSDALLGFVYRSSDTSVWIKPFYTEDVLSKFNVPVKNLRDENIKGFVSLIDKGRVYIDNVSLNAEIKAEDVWVTSNEVPEVPPGLIVGRTKFIVKSDEVSFIRVALDLVFDASTLDLIYFIRV